MHLDRNLIGYGRCPPIPNWPGGARLALNFVVNYEEGSEATIPDGETQTEIGLTESSNVQFPEGVRTITGLEISQHFLLI